MPLCVACRNYGFLILCLAVTASRRHPAVRANARPINKTERNRSDKGLRGELINLWKTRRRPTACCKKWNGQFTLCNMRTEYLWVPIDTCSFSDLHFSMFSIPCCTVSGSPREKDASLFNSISFVYVHCGDKLIELSSLSANTLPAPQNPLLLPSFLCYLQALWTVANEWTSELTGLINVQLIKIWFVQITKLIDAFDLLLIFENVLLGKQIRNVFLSFD